MNDRKLPLTTKIDNFRKLREKGFYYIDKSLMIQEFLSYQDEVSLITRPRRFGKTLNMTMMREFFDINQKSDDLFSGLAIMETEYVNQLNSRPVVFLSFKGCSGTNIEKLKLSLARVLKYEYFKHMRILRESKKVDWESDEYSDFYQTYIALKNLEKEDKNKISDETLKGSLFALTRTLTNFYCQKPLVLIDEYDQPLMNAHEEGFREAFSKGIYADFLSDALKGNDYLHQALLTGIQRIAKESIFSKLNHFDVYTMADDQYAFYFGFTDEETEKALTDYGMNHDEDVRRYYDGYSIGGYDIYNPWSIMSYIKKKKLGSFWINTSTNYLIRELIANANREFHEVFEELIIDGEALVYVNLEAAFIELDATETLWGLLVNSGYLTIVKDLGEGDFILRIPNHEVKREFRKIVAIYIGVGSSRLSQIFNALIRKDMMRFLQLYQNFIYDVISCHDVKQTKPENKKPYHLENSYQMLFLGMAASVEGMYKVTSNLETGDGRSDVLMESLQADLRPHIIIEFKMGDDLTKLKRKGLEQIFENRYYKQLRGNVLCVGIANNMKRCELVHEEIFVNEFGEIMRLK